MEKYKLLLLDANVVIELFEQGIWDEVVEKCEIYLSRTVAEKEALFWEDHRGRRHTINMQPYEESGRVEIFDLSFQKLKSYRESFGSVYFKKLDPGENESLAFLSDHKDVAKICSADKIVYRVLGNLHMREKGISLEEILDSIGLGRRLRHEFCKAYRKKWTRKGFQEKMRGLGQTE